MNGRFLTQKDMSAAKHEQEVWNSLVKRGKIDESNRDRFAHVVCGCGAEGCIFISGRTNDGVRDRYY
jgi:hypothetical protein